MNSRTRHRDRTRGSRNRDENRHSPSTRSFRGNRPAFPAGKVKGLCLLFGTVAISCVLIVLMFPLASGGGPWRTQAADGPLPPLFAPAEVRAGLPPLGPTTRVPVNSIDRFTGQPIIASSPTITYKGYVVAFCCLHSTGYTGGWDRLTEAEKDTYVRGFLK